MLPDTPLERLKWCGRGSKQEHELASESAHPPAEIQAVEEQAEQYLTDKLKLPNIWNVIRLLFTSHEPGYATFRLWKTTGYQVDLYGFPTFGPTVVPYELMGLLNILATILTSQYRPDLEHAKLECVCFAGAIAEGDVGAIKASEKTAADMQGSEGTKDVVCWAVTLLPIMSRS